MASSPCENLPGLEFSDGSIELDLKGKEIQGASFIGVAFHGVGRSSPARDARAAMAATTSGPITAGT
jgi:hypothetical protein